MFRFRVADKKDENQPDEQQNQQPQQQPPQENLTAEEMRQRRLQALSRFSSPKHPSDQSTSSPSNMKHESPPKRQKLDDAMEIDEEISTTTTPVKVQQQTPPVKQSPSSDIPKKKITLQEKFEHEILQRVVNPPPLPMKIFPNAERFVFDIHAEVLIFEKLKTLKTGQDVLLFINRAFMMSEDELSRENARKEKSKPERVSVLTRLSELLLNYLVLFVSEPQSFIASPLTSDALLQILLDEDNPNNALDEKILAKLVTIESESTKQLWENILEQMSQRFAKFDMLERYFPYLLVLNRLLRYKEIAIIMVNHPKWLPSVKSGALMESGTILGPFFRLSAYFDHPKVGEQFFGNGQLNGMTQKDLDFKRQTLRSEIKMYQDTLHKIFMNLVRPKETRNKAVEWLQTVLVGNKSRLKMHEDIYSSSSESFLTNYCALVLKLCEPFLAAEANKYRTIDADYPMLNTAISFKDDTHINATEAEAKELYANETGTREWSFVTECFFICYRALKIGFIKTLEKYHHVLQSYHEIRRELKRIPKEDPRHAQGEKELANMLMIMVTAEVHILDPGYHRCILQFYRFASKFLLYTAAPDKTNEDQLITNAADKEKIPRAFKCLSEFMILDTIEFSKFALTRSVESFAAGEELEQILTMLITFTRYDHYIKNPYVRAKVPDLYTTLIPKSFRDNQRDTDLPMAIENLLIKHKASQEHLMAAFIDLYIDMEHTGSSHQFYEKFTPRYFIALLFKYLWQFPIYRNAFVQETNQNSQFVKFFNLMLNDATFLLDESLKILTDIRNYEQEWDEETQTGTRPSDQQMQGRARQEQQLRGNMQLARETVHMMTYLSKDVPQPFLRPEMVQRVASMLNYFLVELAGPQCQNLKVKNPEKYFFNPKELLSEITDTFINFSGFDEFVHAVATDSRSFKPEIFERVVGILRKIGTRPETSIRKFQAFSLKAMEVAQQTITEEEDLGEVPDEFLDPITYTLMEDPVLLPASQIFIDRSTIERHLLNDQTDPFNRSHLTQDMLLPGTEMKDKIREWKESAKKK